ncbi:hypothetical protein ACEUAC_07825 [Aeromonas veronii]|nr:MULTISPECIES: hypothetical protein [Aeromonas]GJA16607.1 hypothetical protein KAM335_38030 [Aeromonas caviae]GJA25418.1 hypothetical protein KAM337_39460 [Aeromonas caviae]GJB21723.1 hypothetical protein KAM364_36350 [Aeromonas caviae]
MRMNEMEKLRLYKEALRILDDVEAKLIAARIAHEQAMGYAKAA